MPSPPRALLDADVLYSGQVRNLILQLAAQEVISVAWSEAIEREWLRNMAPRTLNRIRVRTLPLLREHFPDAWVRDADEKADVGRTDAKDVHVAAAAIKIAPSTLVSWNVKHFDVQALQKRDVSVATPDEFLCGLFDANPALTMDVAKNAAANLTKSAPTWDAYLAVLSNNRLKRFVERLRRYRPGDEDDTNLVSTVTEAGDVPQSDRTTGRGKK
jgi:hypothetical protein